MLKLLLLLSLVINAYPSSLKKANRYYKNNNIVKATKYYKKACEEGIQKGCDAYNELENPIAKAFTLISQSRGEEALIYLKEACEKGFTRGCTIYESSTGESISPNKDITYFNKIFDYMLKERDSTHNIAAKIALRYIWGKPILNNLKYDVKNQYFTADLTFQRKKTFHKEITISISPENQIAFQTAFPSLKPKAIFNVNNKSVVLKTIHIFYSNKRLSIVIP